MKSGNRPINSKTPDVELTAGVKVRELRFKKSPQAESFPEPPDHEGYSSESERENLPKPVQSGVTYHDISVRWEAASRIVRIEKDVREEE